VPAGETVDAPADLDAMEELLPDHDEVSDLERTTVDEHDALRFDVIDADGGPS
jgi:hypothetical protein